MFSQGVAVERGFPSPHSAGCTARHFLWTFLLWAACAPCRGQEHAAAARPFSFKVSGPGRHRAVGSSTARALSPSTGLEVSAWFDLGPAGGSNTKFDTAAAPPNSEEITVYAKTHNHDADWRADVAAGQPVYEAGNSEAAQPGYGGYPQYTSAEQERLMSIKSDLLGLCGALGGYIQCPNKPP